MYSELHCLTNFTFLRGASHADELVSQAVELGYEALAITDECSVAGVVRAFSAVREQEEKGNRLKLIIGSEFRFEDGLRCVLLAMNRAGYGQLCRLITRARRAAVKGSYLIKREDVYEMGASFLSYCLVLWLPDAEVDFEQGRWMREAFPDRCWIAVELLSSGSDASRLQCLQEIGRELGMPLVAAGDVHMHVRQRRFLQDTLTAIRLGVPLSQAGFHLYANAERYMRPIPRLQELYPEALLAETGRIAARCTFSLKELRYEYPEEVVPQGQTPSTYLRQLTEEGIRKKWPKGIDATSRAQIEKELELIAKLKYEPFFLTVYEIVQFAQKEKILYQGRGSAANSLVCYCLGITAVSPERSKLLFERFISSERDEPPDIDVDFEHSRREEVIQHVYEKYGRHRTAIAATVISYRPRSAIRDVGKALGLDLLQIDRLARTMQWWDGGKVDGSRIREAGFDPAAPVIRQLVYLTNELVNFPRHLSQHVGGFVIARGLLEELVPIENASMAERTVIQWDKDDLEALGLLKVDVLALGMLTAIRRCFGLVEAFYGRKHTLDSIEEGDQRVYDMICEADVIGVFQIESRAQMSMLPRLHPRSYYDLVIEVAIVRPGPIQGDMVHPYLENRDKQRQGALDIVYPSEKVQEVLGRTLGVPIFQEQVMQLAMVAGGFTGGEADQLRRAMASWKRNGDLSRFETKLREGMLQRGYTEEFARRIYRQIQGFGEYGFPESHSASFALLVYVSAWLKYYYPAAFTAALLNSQPMGFYAPSQLVQDARRHGVEVRPVDVCASRWEATLEKKEDESAALRLGLSLVKGLSEAAAERIAAARAMRAFSTVQEVAKRAELDRRSLNALAAAGAFASLAGNRHQAVWAVSGIDEGTSLLPDICIAEAIPLLRQPREGEDIAADYRNLSLTLRRHPLALLRPRLSREHVLSAEELRTAPAGTAVRTAGLVITRQRPGSGNTIFVTLEDETGSINVIVWQSIAERQRAALLRSRLMQVTGTLQRQDKVIHVIATRLLDRSRWLGTIAAKSRDFH